MSKYELVYLDFYQGFDFVKKEERYLNLEIDLTNNKQIMAFLKKYKPKDYCTILGLVQIPNQNDWRKFQAKNTIMQFRSRINKVSADNFLNYRISLRRNYQGNYDVSVIEKTEAELCAEKCRRKYE
tara:strand:+ start:697 stop:1074 length:378 start_codon:yes stop_codon:yes gene_type:complete